MSRTFKADNTFLTMVLTLNVPSSAFNWWSLQPVSRNHSSIYMQNIVIIFPWIYLITLENVGITVLIILLIILIIHIYTHAYIHTYIYITKTLNV